ncbi:hypothetical protein [uncultured Pseudokineococcus sp.]|uniref:hypothetical protein n=1 Tax=uncultured Pseudokineococcus sp. TaxID=1642928 RepID=UPI002630530D|nr:hypothetical protein [uncultured Pseudokineococcus sp.]
MTTTRAARWLRARLDADRQRGASAAMLVLIVGAALLAGLGFLADTSDRISTIKRVDSAAQEAARAAAQAMDAGDLVVGSRAQLDTATGARAARAYLQAAGVSGQATGTGASVRVTTSTTWCPVMLARVACTELTATATARTARGITEERP